MAFGRYARNRATRLLVPFAVWSGIFGLLKLAEVLLTGVSLGSEFKPYMLVTGPAIHLWFLPFACVASLVAFPLARAGLSDPDRTALWGKVLALTALNAVGLLALALQQDTAWPTPYAQWAFVSPAVCVGLGFAVAEGKPALPALATGAICLIAYAMGWTDGLFQLALASLVLALCQTVRLPETALSRLSATAALGVYLCHPLVISILERTTAITAHTLGFAIATGILAFMLTVTLGATRRYPFTLLFGPQPTGPLFSRLLRRA